MNEKVKRSIEGNYRCEVVVNWLIYHTLWFEVSKCNDVFDIIVYKKDELLLENLIKLQKIK